MTPEPSGQTELPLPDRPAPRLVPEQSSAMLSRFGLLGRLLVRFAFRHVHFPAEAVARIRQLAERGTVVYVMRYRSTVDYLLVNALLLREGLPLARFAPGVTTRWWRPLGELLRRLGRREDRSVAAAHAACAGLVQAGAPVLLFMRSHAVATRRRRALAAARMGPRYLRDVIRGAETGERPVYLLPLAIFRGKGFRKRESRFTTLLYSVQEAPGEAKRLFAYMWNAEQTQVSLGREVDLERFLDDHRREGEDRIARRLARALQIYLYREERVVLGPALLPRRVVREQVVRDPELARLIRRLAAERGIPRRRVLKEARAYFDEMAADFRGFYFSILEFVFNLIWPMMFSGLEVKGLERVTECIKQHPVVLVPSHRSHFDYLILTYIFHTNHLSPPHIAAGINLSFWPMGPLFRGAGAFFIRRTFEDNELYKAVFRKYLAFLIREGYTQEFFIEGGRSRSGKILPPKLGLLSAIVGAFLQGVRRDLHFVPISIHYGRIPEQDAYTRELGGEEKQRESFGALLRAWKVVRNRYGTVYVSYGEPVSLADALGDQRERFHLGSGEEAIEEEKRRFIQRLGFRLVREINSVAVAGASSVSATALLGAPRAACRIESFLQRANALTALLRVSGASLSASLVRNEASNFRESLSWLEAGGLVERLSDTDGVVLHVPQGKRASLDLYKNNTIHFFLVPSLVSRGLLAGVPIEDLHRHVLWWLDFFRWEFPLPERDRLAAELARWLDYFRETGALGDDGPNRAHPFLWATSEVLENFREGYLVTARTVAAQREWPVAEKALLQLIRRQYVTSLLLDEVNHPEGSSVMTFGNALARLEELGYIHRSTRRGGRERWIESGAAHERLPALIRQLRE